MSDYTQITDFSAKDALTTGDPEKIILGADFDGEFAAIETAVATKYDSADIASSAQATAGLLDTVLMTPLQVENVLAQNAGIALDLVDLADPNADRIIFWDDSAGAATFLTATNGLEISGTSLQIAASAAGTGLALSAGVLSVDPGEAALATIAGGDKILFGDASSSDAFSYATWTNVQAAISITESQISDLGTYISSGDTVAALTVTALTVSTTLTETLAELGIEAMSQSDDGFLVSDAGSVKVMPYDQAGVKVVNAADADQTFGQTDANTVQVLDGVVDRTWTIPPAATFDFDIGTVILVQSINTAAITITAGTGVTLMSTYNTGGTTATSDTVAAGGRAALIKVANDEWTIAGNITD